MAEQHRATSEQWAEVKARADERLVHDLGHAAHSTILELLHRIEALEVRNGDDIEAWAAMRRAGSSAAERIGALEKRIEVLEATQQPQPNHPAKPDSSLVDRVEDAIYRSALPENPGFHYEARAAIREVAAWMTSNPDHYFPPALVFVLEQEAEQ